MKNEGEGFPYRLSTIAPLLSESILRPQNVLRNVLALAETRFSPDFCRHLAGFRYSRLGKRKVEGHLAASEPRPLPGCRMRYIELLLGNSYTALVLLYDPL